MSQQSVNYLLYTLQIADNALIMGQRLGEWCGHGPILEQDIAMTNIALDHLGQARSLYQYAAEQFNALPVQERKDLFASVALQQIVAAGNMAEEDDLPYLRDSWDFHNALLVEQPNGDWAHTIARSLFYDTFNFFFYTELQKSKDETLAAIAEKSLKEVTYHLRWSSEWAIRLGDGTEESHQRMQDAVNELWSYAGELMMMGEADNAALQAGIGVGLQTIKPLWQQRIGAVLQEATLQAPTTSWVQEGGKQGRHSEHLGHLLTELQFMQRTYPGMKW